MWNMKIVVLRTTAYSNGCTVKGILFFLRLLHESIVYWASEIAAVHIVHTISSHDRLGISRLHIHKLVKWLYIIYNMCLTHVLRFWTEINLYKLIYLLIKRVKGDIFHRTSLITIKIKLSDTIIFWA